jgi:hypothetical protein
MISDSMVLPLIGAKRFARERYVARDQDSFDSFCIFE